MKTNAKSACASGSSTLVRARFSAGLLLQHEDLAQINYYARDLSRLMFRSLFGCGVVCGLEVSHNSEGRTITIARGLAIDCCGDPIEVPADVTIKLDEHCDIRLDKPLWVLLRGAVTLCAPRSASCSSDDDAFCVHTREKLGYEIELMSEPPADACGCLVFKEQPGESETDTVDVASIDPDCYAAHHDGKCTCCQGCSDGVLLAHLGIEDNQMVVDYHVRRLIRPAFIEDPRTKKPLPDPAGPVPAPIANSKQDFAGLVESIEDSAQAVKEILDVPDESRKKIVQILGETLNQLRGVEESLDTEKDVRNVARASAKRATRRSRKGP